MAAEVYEIARKFSDTPGGRYKRLGPYSGEEFRDVLVDLLSKNEEVEVVLDGTEGYGSSFLEEAFGGLVRLKRWPVEELGKRLRVVARNRSYALYADQVSKFIKDAATHESG